MRPRKFDHDRARALRADGWTYDDLAEEFNVSAMSIWRAVNRPDGRTDESATHLTTAKVRYLLAVAEVTDMLGFPPTVREVGDHVGVTSTSTTHQALTGLRRLGLVDWDVRFARTLHLTQEGYEALATERRVAS